MESAGSPPYERLAAIYDHVMRHVDYRSWAGYLRDLLARYGPSPASVIELACGTGSVGLEAVRLKVPVVLAVDLCEAMLQVAREKALRAGIALDFRRADLRDLSPVAPPSPFAAGFCVYDSFNYLLTPDDLRTALDQVHGILSPGGLFIFDVCTERNSLRYFSDFEDREEGPGFSYERHSFYDARERLQMNRFRIRFEGEAAPAEELHAQRIYPLAEVRAVVAESPFELVAAHDGFTFRKGSDQSDRVHFVIRSR
ncbi:MAG: class I SAM-dependent methyltransferase [Candidatus Latescibacterota bacterium]|jgi:SAM-dependent methyltransferase